MSVSVEVKGLEETERLLSIDIPTMSHEALIKLAGNIVDEARNNLQNNTNIDSGSLLASIKIISDDGETITIGTEEPYASYIEYGRGPVFPLDPSGWLHWIDKDTGKDVFAKKAKATEPSPFLQPAVELETRNFPEVLTEEYNDEVRSA